MNQKIKFEIFIAGPTPRSMIAVSRLRKFCQEFFPRQFTIIIVDLLTEPSKAKSNEIIAIPTIIKKTPKPVRRIVGDLSNVKNIHRLLDLPPIKARSKS